MIQSKVDNKVQLSCDDKELILSETSPHPSLHLIHYITQ